MRMLSAEERTVLRLPDRRQILALLVGLAGMRSERTCEAAEKSVVRRQVEARFADVWWGPQVSRPAMRDWLNDGSLNEPVPGGDDAPLPGPSGTAAWLRGLCERLGVAPLNQAIRSARRLWREGDLGKPGADHEVLRFITYVNNSSPSSVGSIVHQMYLGVGRRAETAVEPAGPKREIRKRPFLETLRDVQVWAATNGFLGGFPTLEVHARHGERTVAACLLGASSRSELRVAAKAELPPEDMNSATGLWRAIFGWAEARGFLGGFLDGSERAIPGTEKSVSVWCLPLAESLREDCLIPRRADFDQLWYRLEVANRWARQQGYSGAMLNGHERSDDQGNFYLGAMLLRRGPTVLVEIPEWQLSLE